MKLRKIGRALFGSYFVYTGISHFLHEKELAQYAKAKNIPMPDAAVIGSGVMLIVGGASLALGLKPKFGAAHLVAFLASVTPAMHNFWSETDPGERQQDMVHFGKNLALLSGALALADSEPDSRAQREFEK